MAPRPRAGPLLVAIEGASGAGKSTLARLLAHRLDALWLPEAYVRLRPRPSLTYADRDELASLEQRLARDEGRRYRYARARTRAGRRVIADTGFLGPLSYAYGLARSVDPALNVVPEVARTFRALLRRRSWGLPDLVLYLDVPPAVQARRSASAARTHPSQFRRRHRVVGKVERVLWTRAIPPVVPGLVRIVDGRGTVETVLDRLVTAISRPPPVRRFPPRAAHRLLTRFLSESEPVFQLGNR